MNWVANKTINLYANLGTVALLSIFWWLYKESTKVSKSPPEPKGPVEIFVPLVKFLSETLELSIRML